MQRLMAKRLRAMSRKAARLMLQLTTNQFFCFVDLLYVGFVLLGDLVDINGDNYKDDFGWHFWLVSYRFWFIFKAKINQPTKSDFLTKTHCYQFY
jgi:hypothetical protein